jgi:hypothetical protein
LVWFKQASSYNAPINRSILLQKANDFGEKLEDFKATDGWLTRWKALFIKDFMEKNKILMSRQLTTGYKLIGKLLNTYSPEDIFNTDETGLYYRATPDYFMIFKNDPASVGKKVKDRIYSSVNLQYDGKNKDEAISNRKE